MARKSIPLQTKLDNLFCEDPTVVEFDDLLSSSMNELQRFQSQLDLHNHLVEGALLNVNRIGSHALSLPCGEYMVWTTDVGHTMLVPTQNKEQYSEVFEEFKENYEVSTKELLKHWNAVERVLSEEIDPSNVDSSEESDNQEMGQENEKPSGQISNKIQMSTVDRTPIVQAMQDRGHTVSSLAAAVGVQPPAISRILRTPEQRQGDPGGRNPSMGLLAKISHELRIDPTAAFPDIFGAKPKYEPRKTPGNRGSGMSGAAAGSQRMDGATWTQGNAQ